MYQLQVVKSFDTLFAAAWYFLSSIGLSKFVDNLFYNFNEEDYHDRSIWRLLLEIIISLWLFLLLSRFIRVLFVDFLFSPFEGVYGYQRRLTKEAAGGVIFAFSLFNYAVNLKKRVTYFGKRVGLLSPEPTKSKAAVPKSTHPNIVTK